MKKIFVTAALAAAGVSSTQAQYTPGLTPMESAKFWTLSGSLRGFYDDNYTTLPRPFAQSSFGLEASPSASIHFNPNDSTLLTASYVYDLRWYENRQNHSVDQSHQLNAKLDHAFTEKYKMQVNESFVVAQEPDVLDATGTIHLRTLGSNFRNTGSADFTADLTQNLGLEVAYQNTIYDYEQNGADVLNAAGAGPSRSGLLDRTEHLASFYLRGRVSPETMAIVGYQYGLVNYDSAEFLDPTANTLAPANAIPAFSRNNRAHYLLVGADHSFNPQLNGSVRVGAQFLDYYDLHHDTASGTPASDQTQVNPYADASLTYTYADGSYLQGGVRHTHNATDVVGSSTTPVLDQESTSVYLSVTHKITAKLTGSLLGQFQHGIFNGGSANDLADDFFTVGLNLAYHINQNFLAEAGYNFDRLDSDIGGRSFYRNRAYIGVRVTY